MCSYKQGAILSFMVGEIRTPCVGAAPRSAVLQQPIVLPPLTAPPGQLVAPAGTKVQLLGLPSWNLDRYSCKRVSEPCFGHGLGQEQCGSSYPARLSHHMTTQLPVPLQTVISPTFACNTRLPAFDLTNTSLPQMIIRCRIASARGTRVCSDNALHSPPINITRWNAHLVKITPHWRLQIAR